MDSDFWYHKGVVLNQKGKNESALNCYKQALKLNNSHTPSIFNLACNYEKLKNYPEAKSWFVKAIAVKDDWPDAYYGLALTCIRLSQTQEAVDAIEKAILYQADEVTNQVLYVRALCYKVNTENAKSLEAYRVIMKDEKSIFDFQNMIAKFNEQMRRKVTGNEDLVTLPWRVDMYTQFKSLNLLSEFNPARYIDLWPYFTTGSGWNIDEIDKVIDLLLKVRFFNRFDSDAL